MSSTSPATLYCCVARGTRILFSVNAASDGELDALSALCLQNTPPFHSWYSHTAGDLTFSFLLDAGVTFLAIADSALGSLALLKFLQQIRDGFRRASRNRLHDELTPIARRLMGSESSDAAVDYRSPEAEPSPSPSTRAPLLGSKMKEKEMESRDSAVESRDRGVRIDVPPEPPPPPVSLQKSSSMRARARRLWWRHVKIVAAVDVLLCMVLFGVWLAVCRGFHCVS